MNDTQKTVLIIVILGLALIFLFVIYKWSTRTPPPASKIDGNFAKAPRSWAANTIKQEFYAIPQDSRPDADIDAIIKALDIKYDVSNTNQHFRSQRFSSAVPAWAHDCARQKCPFQDYLDLHQHIAVLMAAHKKREHALAVAEQQYGFEEMQKLQEQCAQEVQHLIDSTETIEKNGKP